MSIALRRAAKAYRAGEAVAWVIAGLAGIAFCLALIAAIARGPALRAAADQARATEIEQENALFCRKYGMGEDRDGFRACVGDLMEMRSRERTRVLEEFDLP
jgi:hypothetical protein